MVTAVYLDRPFNFFVYRRLYSYSNSSNILFRQRQCCLPRPGRHGSRGYEALVQLQNESRSLRDNCCKKGQRDRRHISPAISCFDGCWRPGCFGLGVRRWRAFARRQENALLAVFVSCCLFANTKILVICKEQLEKGWSSFS